MQIKADELNVDNNIEIRVSAGEHKYVPIIIELLQQLKAVEITQSNDKKSIGVNFSENRYTPDTVLEFLLALLKNLGFEVQEGSVADVKYFSSVVQNNERIENAPMSDGSEAIFAFANPNFTLLVKLITTVEFDESITVEQLPEIGLREKGAILILEKPFEIFVNFIGEYDEALMQKVMTNLLS